MESVLQTILFTGGGSAGHVTPNIALIEKFQKNNWNIVYFGSFNGIEKKLISKLGINYYAISTGKLRRYFSWQNFIDPLKIAIGIIQTLIWCIKLRPAVIFSKGGFVSFPVVVAARILRIPIILHEADLTVGLANRFSFPFATKICVAFPETVEKIANKKKVVITGIPIRQDFFICDAAYGRKICNLLANKKTILVFGGSLGADSINMLIRQLLPELLIKFQIVHICGKGKIIADLNLLGYHQFEYLDREFPHVLAAADLVISRAGANSIYELLSLRKPNILLPLTKNVSRGDQITNARYCMKHGFSQILLEEELSVKSLLDKIYLVDKNLRSIIANIEKFEILPATQIIYKLITTTLR
jgi:UDP-N-acetylglucosamine--N-acetylmuramyl-(pentapeptide) pyrophosphoryl-undecaprenol N-acetylglucosamine transferase